MSSVLRVFEKTFAKSQKNHWYEKYIMIDVHGVITVPNYEIEEVRIDYPKYAKESLQMLTEREDIRLILFTSSYPDQTHRYVNALAEDGIHFNYINENPEIRSYEDFGYYETKPYFDIFLDDKAGFEYSDWTEIYKFLRTSPVPMKSWANPLRRRLSPGELGTQNHKVMSNKKEQI
jgi:hypothetical protein